MMKIFQTVYSVPELHDLSKEEKKRALWACQFIPLKNWKVWLSLLSFSVVPLAAKLSALCLIMSAEISSKTAITLIYLAVQISYSLIALGVLSKVYTPAIRQALRNYFSKINSETEEPQ